MSKNSDFRARQAAILAECRNPNKAPAIRNVIGPLNRAEVIPPIIVPVPVLAPAPAPAPAPAIKPITVYEFTCFRSEYQVALVSYVPRTWIVHCTDDSSAAALTGQYSTPAYEAPGDETFVCDSHIEAMLQSGMPLCNIKEIHIIPEEEWDF